MKIVVVTTAYNCEEWIRQCIISIKGQSYDNFVCYITDDISTDGTVQAAKDVIGSDDRFIIINNHEKLYQPGNYDNVIRYNPDIDDEDIIVEVDGDDWLPDNKVFERVINYYSNKRTWITYGQFKYRDGKKGFAAPVNIKEIRKIVYTVTHLRTWKAFLWRNIPPQQLKVNGCYAKVAGDIFFMMPMLEMATNKHTLFTLDVNYIYNADNPLNDHKGDRAAEQVELAIVGRMRKPFPPLVR